jgi:hypothetical protein
MYVSQSGYAEIFDISASIMEKESKKAAAIQQRLDHVKSLTLPFNHHEVLNCTIAVGGSWAEQHPPICPDMLKREQDDLEAYKASERVKITTPERKEGQVISLKFA